MARRDKYREEDDESHDEPAPRGGKTQRAAREPSRSGWFAKRLAVMLILLAVLVGLAPTIVGRTSLWKTVLGYAQPPLAGKVQIGSISIGWLSPIELTNVAVRDDKGELLAEVRSVRSEKTLFDLASNPRELGKFFILEPHAKLVVRADGSNLEDFLAKFPEDKTPIDPTARPMQFVLEVTRGTIEIDDRVGGRQWQIDGVSATADWPSVQANARTGKLSAAIRSTNPAANPAAPAGEVLADFTWIPSPPSAQPGAKAGLGSGAVQCRFTALPTALAELATRRLGIDIRPAGPLTAEAIYRWKDDGQGQHIQLKQLSSPQLAVVAPDILGSDEIVTAIASGQGDVEIIGGQIIVRELKFDSDLVQLAGSGSTQLASASIPPAAPATHSQPAGSELHVTGTVDLARLATQLPQTLRLRPDTRINSGRVQVSLDGQTAAGEQRLRATLRMDELIAEAAGQQITWDRPVSLTIAASQTPQGPVIEELLAEASFMNVRGTGTLLKGSLTADADLDKLAAELGRFIALGPNELTGKLAANVQWQRGEQDRWQATADARVQQFQWQTATLPWREDDLQLRAEVTGLADATGLKQLDAASLTIASAADRMEVQLTERVGRFSTATPLPLAYSIKGDLATWLPRVQAFVPLAGWQASGAIDLAGSGRFARESVEIGETKLSVNQLAAAGAGLVIQEPAVEVKTSGRWDSRTGTFTSPETTVRSSSLAFLADKLQVVSTAQGTSVTGLLEYQGDLARMSAAVTQPRVERNWQLAGALTGRMEMRYEAGALQAAWTSDIENLTYLTRAAVAQPRQPFAATSAASLSPWVAQWSEPRVSVQGQGRFDQASDRAELTKASFTSSALSLSASGSISEVSLRGNADVQGEIGYDLAGVTEKLRPLLGPSLAITGRDQRKFSLRGPLFVPASSSAATATPTTVGLVPPELSGEAAAGWESAQYVGLQAGAAVVNAKLDRGMLLLGPLDIPLSEGRLLAAPRLLLNEPTPLVVMDKGPLVERVRISPELCHTWLKYVAPLLADATRAEGKFSVALDGAAIPIFDPNTSNIPGTLSIHTAQIGPGPLAQQFIGMANQVKAVVKRKPDAAGVVDPNRGWIVLPDQSVQFHVVEGRVHHRGLTMLVGDVAIVTQGSVGMDQTINLTASIPVQESWIKGDTLLSGLRGKTIDIPISGNLAKPKLDGRVLEELGRKLVGNAAQGLLEKGLNEGVGRGLERLFGPRPSQPSPTP